MAVTKIDPKVIFASEAPDQDTPAVFVNKTVGWGESRKNGGRPTIKQSNALQQETDLKILWLNENAVTPYDATIDYPQNAVTIKDGEFKILNNGIWETFLSRNHSILTNRDAASSHPASAISTATSQTQQVVNDSVGAKWYAKVGGYPVNARVMLDDGDIVKSTVDNNTVNPNTDMTGWVGVNYADQLIYSRLKNKITRTIYSKLYEDLSVKDFGATGDASLHTIQEWVDSGKFSGLTAIQMVFPFVTSLTQSIDYVALQAACNAAGNYGAIKIIGCLFLQQGEKVTTLEGQHLYGLDDNKFINTNNGVMFTGALTGNIPKCGIYYDGTTGAALRAKAGVSLSGFHLFGKGYVTANGTVNILDPKGAKVHDTIGVEVEKFIQTRNMSFYYLGKALNSVSSGGNFYSRHYFTEITRCNVAYSWDETAYNQQFFGCIIRNTPTPFVFASGKTVRTFNFYGGSIEGYRPVDSNDFAIGVPANSMMQFNGTYWENLDTDGPFDTVFKPIGGNIFLQFNSCTVYLNHYLNFVKQTSFTKVRVASSKNEFYLSTGSSVLDPIIYSLSFTAGESYLETDGTDKINYDINYPNSTTTGDINSGSNTLTVTDATNIRIGQRIRVGSLTTCVTAISGTTITLQGKSGATLTGATVDLYYTPQYVPFSLGTNLLNANIVYPSDYLPRFDNLNFSNRDFAHKARTTVPDAPFNGAALGVAIYTADGTTWNPARFQSTGAYQVAYRNGRYIPMLGPVSGKVTLTAGQTVHVVPNTYTTANSKVILEARSLSAAKIVRYVSATSNAVSFSITTETAAAGTEVFDYYIHD